VRNVEAAFASEANMVIRIYYFNFILFYFIRIYPTLEDVDSESPRAAQECRRGETRRQLLGWGRERLGASPKQWASK
jgi:hypothetical protein